MTREELILDCRYYNGEEDPPEIVDSLFWGYEEVWVKWMLEGDPHIEKHIKYYTEQYNLPNLLPEDGTPLGLKAILFSRYDYWSGGYGGGPNYGNDFKKWYLGNYVGKTKTHRQLLNNE